VQFWERACIQLVDDDDSRLTAQQARPEPTFSCWVISTQFSSDVEIFSHSCSSGAATFLLDDDDDDGRPDSL
jgi:hypothetical protein